MTPEPGRNEPCPCGSGKKYKRCCQLRCRGFAVPARPIEGEPRNTHFEMGPDGKWIEQPGSLWMQVHMEAADSPDAEICDFFRAYRSTLTGAAELQERVRDCEHKCRAVDYHRRAVHREIQSEMERYAKEHRAQSGAAFIMRNEVLLYECEAFLFQAKSAVDAFVRVLAPVVPALRGFDMFRGKGPIAGGAVLEAISGQEPDLHAALENAREEWIQELKELRDTVTHVSELEGFTYFVERQYHGGPDAFIDLPTMPSGKRLDVYCDDTLDHLMDLARVLLNIVVSRAVGV